LNPGKLLCLHLEGYINADLKSIRAAAQVVRAMMGREARR
jgi:hypothetical protein